MIEILDNRRSSIIRSKMITKTFDTEFVCTVLRDTDLLNDEQVQHIRLQEEKHRKLLQSKVLKDVKNGSGSNEQGIEQITIVDVINSMHLPLPANQENILTEELIMKAAIPKSLRMSQPVQI